MNHHHVSAEPWSDEIIPSGLSLPCGQQHCSVSMPSLPTFSNLHRRKRLKSRLKCSFLQDAEMLHRWHNLSLHYRDSDSENLCALAVGDLLVRKIHSNFLFPKLLGKTPWGIFHRWARLCTTDSEMVSSASRLTWLFSPRSWYFFPWVAAYLINLISPGPQPFHSPSSWANKGVGSHFKTLPPPVPSG